MRKNALETRITFRFCYTCFAAGLMHLTFLCEFVVFKLFMMALINVISVMLYAIFGIVTLKYGMGKKPAGWIIAMFAEVLTHAVIVTVIQGLDVSFHLYPLMAIPLYAYYLYCYCDKKTFVKTAVGMGGITLIILAAVITFVETAGTVYEITGMHVLSDTEVAVLRGVNIVFAMIMMVTFVVIFYTEVMNLLSKLRETNDQLNFIATHDALTGLSNRHSLWKYFENLEQLGSSYCIVMGDLDDFKKINDTYGHDCGDIVLKSVSKIILDSAKAGDMACRWGGEEILLVMLGEREECLSRLSEVKKRINELDITHEGQSVRVSMTFGFADSAEKESILVESGEVEKNGLRARADSHSEFDSLISVVDKRLYVGKRSGKNVIISTQSA